MIKTQWNLGSGGGNKKAYEIPLFRSNGFTLFSKFQLKVKKKFRNIRKLINIQKVKVRDTILSNFLIFIDAFLMINI